MGGSATAAGAKLGRYQIVKHLASGGMAEVLLARASGIEGFTRHVVIKRIRPGQAKDQAFVQMFLNEARLAAQLHHANIVQVHDIGQEGNEYFFAMEYVHGEDLRRLLTHLARHKQRIPVEHAVTVISNAAAALHHAHEQRGPDRKPLGLVHRDVTPANILVSYDGNVKVVDFGIAKAVAGKTVETQAGTLKGKASYMSPEQCTGAKIDRRSDVFALGIVLYELVTTRRLFKGENDFLTMTAIVAGKIPLPTTHRKDLPAALEAIIMKALALKPEDRYQTGEAMREALEQFALDAKLRVSTSQLAAYMKQQFGERPEPWLVEDDEPEMELTLDFDGSASGIAPPPLDAVNELAIPQTMEAMQSSPIMKARTKAATTDPPSLRKGVASAGGAALTDAVASAAATQTKSSTGGATGAVSTSGATHATGAASTSGPTQTTGAASTNGATQATGSSSTSAAGTQKKPVPAAPTARPAKPIKAQIPTAVAPGSEKSRPFRIDSGPIAAPLAPPARKKAITVQIPVANQAAGVAPAQTGTKAGAAKAPAPTTQAPTGTPATQAKSASETPTTQAKSAGGVPSTVVTNDESAATQVTGIPMDVDTSWDPSRPITFSATADMLASDKATNPSPVDKPASPGLPVAKNGAGAATVAADSKTPAKPSDTAAKPSDTAPKPSDTAAKPSTAKPSDTAAKPSDTAAKPSDSVTKPANKASDKPAELAPGDKPVDKITSRKTPPTAFAKLPSVTKPGEVAQSAATAAPSAATAAPRAATAAAPSAATAAVAASGPTAVPATGDSSKFDVASISKPTDPNDSSTTSKFDVASLSSSRTPVTGDPLEAFRGAVAGGAGGGKSFAVGSAETPSAADAIRAADEAADQQPSDGSRESAPSLPPPPVAKKSVKLPGVADVASGNGATAGPIEYPRAADLPDAWSGGSSAGQPSVLAKLRSPRYIAIAAGAVLLLVVIVFATRGDKQTSANEAATPVEPPPTAAQPEPASAPPSEPAPAEPAPPAPSEPVVEEPAAQPIAKPPVEKPVVKAPVKAPPKRIATKPAVKQTTKATKSVAPKPAAKPAPKQTKPAVKKTTVKRPAWDPNSLFPKKK